VLVNAILDVAIVVRSASRSSLTNQAKREEIVGKIIIGTTIASAVSDIARIVEVNALVKRILGRTRADTARARMAGFGSVATTLGSAEQRGPAAVGGAE
jgi:putative cell wall-binding protein